MTTSAMQHNNTALITGASRGLGLALARGLAARGWRLIIDARGGAALDAAYRDLVRTTHVVAITGDIADVDHRRHLAEAAAEAGGIDALINNAGVLGTSPLPRLLEYRLDELEEVFRVNVVAQLGVIQEIHAKDALRTGGAIVNITSDASVEAYAGWGGYGASKAALEQLSAVLAVEVPDARVYRVDPGDMRTTMHQDAYPGEDIGDRPLPGDSVPGIIALIESNLPSGRYAAKSIAVAEAVGV